VRFRVRSEGLRRLLLFLAPALVTVHRFWNGLVFDDVFVIKEGDFIHALSNLPRAFTSHTMVASSLDAAVGRPAMDTYRPLSLVTFFVDAQLSGRSPWAYHVTNTVAHGVVCVLMYEVLRTCLAIPARLSVLLALAFGLAPWLAEAHVFINGRSDVFMTLLVLASLLLQHRSLSTKRVAASALAAMAWLGALLCKEPAVMALPFILLVPSDPEPPWRARARHGVAYLVALAAYAAMRTEALSGLRTHTDLGQLRAALRNLPLLIADGTVHALLPSPIVLRNLRDDYAEVTDGVALGCGVALVLLAAVLVSTCRRVHGFLWSAGFAVASLAPAAMISTVLWPGFGRYLYLPAVGLHAALGCLLAEAGRRWPNGTRWGEYALAPVCVVAALMLADATWVHRDEEALYGRALARAPDQAWTSGSLGLARKREGRCTEALPLLGIAAQRAPDEPRYRVHFARCLLALGQPAGASEVARAGRADFAGTRAEAAFLIIAVLATPEDPEAPRLLARCLALDPARTDCRTLLDRLSASRAAPEVSPHARGQ